MNNPPVRADGPIIPVWEICHQPVFSRCPIPPISRRRLLGLLRSHSYGGRTARPAWGRRPFYDAPPRAAGEVVQLYFRYTTCSNATQTAGGPSEGRCSYSVRELPVLSCAFYFAGEIRILVGTERVPIARYEVSFHVHLRFIFVLNSLRHRSLQYPQGSTHAA